MSELTERLRELAKYCGGQPNALPSKYSPDIVTPLREAATRIERLEAALKGMVDIYVSLVNCGDCGNWNPEKENEVIGARAALEEE